MKSSSSKRSGEQRRGSSKKGDARTSITILVLGDEGVGKSSLISTFVSRHFSEVVSGIMTPVRLPPSEPNDAAITTILDSQQGDKALLASRKSEGSLASLLQKQPESSQHSSSSQQQQQQAQHKTVDSIILVYDLDRVETFYRLENHWLPLIEKFYDGEIPVIVAGNKWDLVRPAGVTTEEQSLVRSRQQLVSLLQRFRFVRQCIKCSAKNLLRVQEVFTKAQQAVLYPFSPLFDLSTGQLTRDCQKALTRIFRMYDQDHDGLLSNAELDAFQYQTFRLPLLDKDLAGWKKVVSRNNTTQEVVKDGKFTVAGFLAIFDVFISQNRLDVPWKVLRKFGYSNELELRLPGDRKTSSSSPSSLPSPKLSFNARYFLAALFQQFDTDGDGVLSGDNLAEIFSIVPDPALPPWHPLRAPQLLQGCFSLPAIMKSTSTFPGASADSVASKDNSMDLSVSASGITIASSAASLPTVGDYHTLTTSTTTASITLEPMSFLDWMGHWHMLATISPTVARAELFRLGYVASSSSNSNSNTTDPGRSSKRRNQYLASILPSEELRILVVGSQGCGKTTLLRLLCGDSVGSEPAPTIHAETTTTHKKFKRKKSDSKKEESSSGNSSGKDGASDDDIVVHFIFTEVPRNADEAAWTPLVQGSSKTRPLVVFCYDSEKSLFDAIEMEKKFLEDEVARVYVVTRGAQTALNNEAAEHCKELDLETPLVVETQTATADRGAILDHLARCGLSEKSGLMPLLKSKPHAEQKKREAARRRKMFWLGGLVSVSVAVAVGVLWGSVVTKTEGGERGKVVATSRFSWLTDMIFGRNSVAVTTTTDAGVDA